MGDGKTTEQQLGRLRELILGARSIPMSASCLINRAEVLQAVDAVIQQLSDDLPRPGHVLDESRLEVTASEAHADRLVSEQGGTISRPAKDNEVVQAAERLAAQVKADAEIEAAALRRETDVFIDARMASFESVLNETTGQVRTARRRLSERSSLERAD